MVAPRHSQHRIVMVLDGVGWHHSATLKASADVRLLRLLPYAPELSPVEHIWGEVREKYLHHKAICVI